MKTILTMVMVVMVTTFTFAGGSGVQAAKKNLNKEIGIALNEDVNESGNYFEMNQIYNVKENMKVSFYVNDEQELVLLQVKTGNKDAKDYMKHFFKSNRLKADKVLCGQAFSLNLYLRYKAR